MADDNSGDLVSNVAITGTGETSAELRKMGDDGASAFEKLAAAAKAASNTIAEGSDKIVESIGHIGEAAPDDKVPTRIEKVGDAVITLKQSITSSIGAITSLATKIEAIGAAGIAGVFGIAKFASSVTKSFRDLSETQNTNIRDTQAQGKAAVEAARASNQYDASILKLQDGLRAGKLSYGDYGNAVTKLNKEFDINANAQARVAAAQADANRKNDAVKRAQAETAAYKKLTDVYGGPLTESLIKLGTTYDSVHKQAVDAFSPALSKLVDAVGNVIDKNRGAITKFLDDGSAALENFIKNNGPEIENFFHTMVDVIKGVGNIIVAVVVPAFGILMSIAQKAADFINSIFGTKLTAGTLIAAAAVVFFTGAIGTAITVISSIVAAIASLIVIFSPLGLIIAAVVVALIAFGASVNWTKVGADARAAATAIAGFFSGLPATIGAFFTSLWQSAGDLASAAGQFVIDAWNAVVAYFAAFPGNLVAIFTALWGGIVSLAQAAAQTVVDGWNVVITFFQALPGTIGQFFTDLWNNVTQLAATAGQLIVDGWNAIVQFFSTLPAVIGQFFVDLWTKIQQTAQQAFTALGQIVKGWVDSTLEVLKPILDAIKAVKDYFSSGSGTSGNNAPAQAFSGGGHVQGSGTSTSDSIAAWLSNNEFVMRAKAVGKYGLRFMQAINDGSLDLSRMLGFAAGGLVQSLQGNQAPRLAFASGGLATTHASRVLNLSIGGEQFNGLIMPDDVANKLTKFAVGRQTSSAGRKPAWVGGRK